MHLRNPLVLIIFSTLVAYISCNCDPDDCPGSYCCIGKDRCGHGFDDIKCDVFSCEHRCPSKCCYGGGCNEDDSQCQSSKRLKVIIIIIAAACFVSLVCIIYMKKHQARRRFFASQRASQASRNRSRVPQNNAGSADLNQDVYIFQAQANAPSSPSPLLNFNPRNLGVESGMPFREGSMKSAYELNYISNIEYGEVSYDQQLIKKANQKEMEKLEQGKQEGSHRPESPQAISLGDFMLKSQYQLDESKGGSGHLSGLEN